MPVQLLLDIWEELTSNSLISQERDIMYKWFGELNQPQQNYQNSYQIQNKLKIDSKDLESFFNQHMCKEKDLVNLTVEGFQCFKTVFVMINEKLNNLQRVQQSSGYKGTKFQSSGVTMQYISYSSNEDKKDDNTEFKVKVDPKELFGLKQLWFAILCSSTTEVIQTQLEFLNKLYENLHEQIKDNAQQYKTDQLQQAIETLETNLREQNSEQKVNALN